MVDHMGEGVKGVHDNDGAKGVRRVCDRLTGKGATHGHPPEDGPSREVHRAFLGLDHADERLEV